MERRVLLFTQAGCTPCFVIRTILLARGVAFEERNISQDPVAARELTEKYHSHSTPTLVIGDEVLTGFDPQRIDALLGG